MRERKFYEKHDELWEVKGRVPEAQAIPFPPISNYQLSGLNIPYMEHMG